MQRLPKILDLVHLGIEEHGIKFALTGSSVRKLRYGASNMLAGRAVTLDFFRSHLSSWLMVLTLSMPLASAHYHEL